MDGDARLAAHFLPPIVASAAVLRWADVEALRQHPAGRYVLVHMPPAGIGPEGRVSRPPLRG